MNIRRKILEFIVEQQSTGQGLPSQADVRQLFGGLTDNVDLHLEQLAREGLLVLDRDGGNGISLVQTYFPATQIKVLGELASRLAQVGGGTCNGSIALDLRSIGVATPGGMFAVQVLDDRMIDAGIEHGDIALLISSTPMRGDIVAIEQAEVVVLRRYVVVSGIPHFLAENSHKPELRPGWETKMQGVLWGLIRTAPSRRLAKAAPQLAARERRGPSKALPLPTSLPKRGTKGPSRGKPEKSRTFPAPKPLPAHPIVVRRALWPEPPSGSELNESTAPSVLTEEFIEYELWGEPRSNAQEVEKDPA